MEQELEDLTARVMALETVVIVLASHSDYAQDIIDGLEMQTRAQTPIARSIDEARLALASELRRLRDALRGDDDV